MAGKGFNAVPLQFFYGGLGGYFGAVAGNRPQSGTINSGAFQLTGWRLPDILQFTEIILELGQPDAPDAGNTVKTDPVFNIFFQGILILAQGRAGGQLATNP